MKIGAPLPSFTIPDQDDNAFSSDSLRGTPCIIYFYPQDETFGCTRQACSIRDQYSEVETLGARVIGISTDSPETHRGFIKHYDLPFTLLSDRKGEVGKLFDVESIFFGLIPGRETFVFDAGGKLIGKFSSVLQFKQHIEKALDILREKQA